MAYPRGAERAAEKRGSVTTKEFKQALKDASALVGEEIVLAAVPPLRIAKMVKRFQDLTEKSARLKTARKIQQATKEHVAARSRKGSLPSGGVRKQSGKESEVGKRLIGGANKRVAAELRRAATARAAKRMDSFRSLTGHSRFSMGAGAKKLDAIPGVKYIDPEDAGPEARNTLAFLKDHKGVADFRLVKQGGKTKVMAVQVEGIHSAGGKAGTKEVHIFNIGEKNAKSFLGY